MSASTHDTARQIVIKAIAWWKQRRPVGHNVRQHMANPTVNCANEQEKNLAIAVAHYLGEYNEIL